MQAQFRFKGWIVAIAAAALVVSGCSEAGPSGSGSQAEATGTGSGGNGTINFQLYQQASSFNPFVAGNGGDSSISLLQFQPLLTVTGTDYLPRIADKWDVSSDAKTYTFHLRKATWSDGQPITTKDVLYTVKTTVDPKTGSLFAAPFAAIKGAKEFAAGSASDISGLTAPDDSTVKVELLEPDVSFLAAWPSIGIVPEHIYSSIGNDKLKGSDQFRNPTVGSGPYVFSKWPSDDVTEFVANPKFWTSVPAAALTIKFLTGDTALAQLQTGELDIGQIPAVEVEPQKAAGTFNVMQAPSNSIMTLHTALKSGKLADKRVRQAILYAIDRQSIIDKVLAGQATVVQTALFSPDWALPSDLVKYDYNPDKAKQLLAEAGWKADTQVNLDITPGQADRDTVMNIIAGQLKAVGMNATVRPSQPAQLTELVKNNQFDLLITMLGQSPPTEPARINIRLLCDQQAPAGTNITGYCNPDLDKLLLKGAATLDQNARKDIYQQANKIINDDVPILPLYRPTANYGVAKRISGFDPSIPLTSITVNAESWVIAQG